MPDNVPRILRAWLDSLSSGIVEFDRNWPDERPPRLTFGPGTAPIEKIEPAPGLMAGRVYGYFESSPGEISFVMPIGHGGEVAPADHVFVAGDFNGWQDAAGKAEWELVPAMLDDKEVLIWTGPAEKILTSPAPRFKFVTAEQLWLGLPNDAPNAVRDEHGNLNRQIERSRTGRHLWRFFPPAPMDLAEPRTIGLVGTLKTAPVPVGFGHFFFELKTDLPLGAIIGGNETIFRLFAPRARAVMLHLCSTLSDQPQAHTYPLARRSDSDGVAGVWEVTLDQNLLAWYYWYTIDGVREGVGRFDPQMRVLDPYALATVDRTGPGIILSRDWANLPDSGFRTPAWHDLVIVEAHVRDLVASAPVAASPEERRGFVGLRKWVESPAFYLHDLGINCVELQPVQEFDNAKPEDYHWGYMTNNFFSPDSSYSLAPEQASGVSELQELITAFHRRQMAVILDVVYNHVGEPAHLLFIDKLYYFEHDHEGNLSNWSGCGNDLRAYSAMAKRLIIDSCTHLIKAYGADGFRFDLAELLGVDLMREIEIALKQVKPDVILIAEPWSLRGHIAGALRDTGWASWNDGYRSFLPDYVRGRGTADRLEYFIRGSPWYFAKWPAQTINYTESHDDRTWLDVITENPGNDGSVPTPNDIRRTHLMAAILFMSIGTPMLAEGQDFLRSKKGVNNTYLRGDLNALDYRRLYRHLGTHAYFGDWIEFRRSPKGRLLRQFSRPSEGFFQFFRGSDPASVAVLYNADRSQGSERLLFGVNPTSSDVSLRVGDEVARMGSWKLLANHERFFSRDSHGAVLPVESELFLPALGCGLWICEA